VSQETGIDCPCSSQRAFSPAGVFVCMYKMLNTALNMSYERFREPTRSVSTVVGISRCSSVPVWSIRQGNIEASGGCDGRRKLV
jgi:hypothetical protein